MNRCLLVIALGLVWVPAFAFEGCFIGNQPYAALDRLPDGSPNPRPIVDFYFDDEFTGSANLNGMSAEVAEEVVKQALVGFQSEAGAPIFFRFAGYSPPAPSLAGRPMVVFTAADEVEDACESLDAVVCASWTPAVPEMLWGKVWFIRNGPPMGDLSRGIVLHEVLHTLRMDHPDEPPCAAQWSDDKSVLGSLYFQGLTMGDKRNIRTAYGYSEQTVRWRQSQPFGAWTWSAPTSLVTELALGPPRASNGRGRNHGVAYPVRAWGAAGRPWVRLYEDPVWLAPERVTEDLSTYHSPDLAWGDNGNIRRWAVVVPTNDYREAWGPDLVVAEREEGTTTWNQSTVLNVNLRTPWAAIAHDPISGKWVIVHLDNGSTGSAVVRVVTPGALSWHGGITMGGPWRFYRGLDVACSERINTSTGGNCLIVGIGSNEGVDYPGPGQIVNQWFRVSGTTPISVGNASSFSIRADLPPQIAANPIGNSDPQFLISYTRSDSIDGWRKVHFRTLSDNAPFWGGLESTYTAANDDRQYLPFSVGTHVFGGIGYHDLLYSLDY
jgi:hypothetical protein